MSEPLDLEPIKARDDDARLDGSWDEPEALDRAHLLREVERLNAEVARRDEQIAAVRAIYDLQAPLRTRSAYIDKGAYFAHQWWLKLIGGALGGSDV